MDPAALIAIEHDATGRRFIARIDGKEAYLEYRPVRTGVVDYVTTYTPPALRERHIASTIVRHALDHARDRELKVIPSCWFVAGYIERHREYEELLTGTD